VAQRDQSEVRAIVGSVEARLKKAEATVAVMEEITLTLSSDVGDLKARVAAQDVEIRRLRDERDRVEDLLRRYSS
jgi:multidrug resistance efflux pump